MINAKELIEGLIQDYTTTIEKGQEHINCLDRENNVLEEHKKTLTEEKQAEVLEMVTFNNHQKEMILEEMIEKNKRLRYYKQQLNEYEQTKTN